jgi:hypothetical protein
VLSFDTVHAVTDCLLDADAHAEAAGFAGPGILLLLQDRPLPPSGPRRRRLMRAIAFTLRPQDLAGHAEGIAAMLHRLATSLDRAPGSCLTGPPTQAGIRAGTTAAVTSSTAAPRVGICADAIANATPGTRLLAWAVLYHDVLAGPGGICQARRVDAVDIDGRVYQITRLRGEAVAVVVLDDQPDPDDTPATQPGLTALLAATRRLAHHHRTHDDANKGAQP